MAAPWGPHRKPLHLRGFDLKLRFDGSIARLLDAGGWLMLRAGGWLRLSWARLNSGGRFACWFRKVAGCLRCFVWGLTRSGSGGIHGFTVRSLQKVVVQPFTNTSNEISMVLESPGRCCAAVIDGFGFSRRLL